MLGSWRGWTAPLATAFAGPAAGRQATSHGHSKPCRTIECVRRSWTARGPLEQ